MKASRQTNLPGSAFVLALIVCASTGSAAPRHAPKTPAAPVAEAAPVKDAIAYENLHGYLGDRITVHTKFGTTRTGTLARFSQTELALTIDTPGGATEMTIPKDTIASMVAAPAAAAH
jgi:hypothetical protein